MVEDATEHKVDGAIIYDMKGAEDDRKAVNTMGVDLQSSTKSRESNTYTSKEYIESFVVESQESRRVRLFFQLLFSALYFVCAAFYLSVYIKKFTMPEDNEGFLAWASHNITLDLVRDYLMALCGYVVTMLILNPILPYK